jgi:hypothetical protein
MVLAQHKNAILNPQTNRFVNVGSSKYKRLIREGVIKAYEEPEPITEPDLTPPSLPTTPPPLLEKAPKDNVPEAMTQLALQNMKAIKKTTSDAELQSLLRKLLLEKLSPESKATKSKPKKKKKKPKFKVREPSSESEDTSESDSDSD